MWLQLRTFGFRLPFLLGFLVAVAGLALHKQVSLKVMAIGSRANLSHGEGEVRCLF